jgi:hypothetical protein
VLLRTKDDGDRWIAPSVIIPPSYSTMYVASTIRWVAPLPPIRPRHPQYLANDIGWHHGAGKQAVGAPKLLGRGVQFPVVESLHRALTEGSMVTINSNVPLSWIPLILCLLVGAINEVPTPLQRDAWLTTRHWTFAGEQDVREALWPKAGGWHFELESCRLLACLSRWVITRSPRR